MTATESKWAGRVAAWRSSGKTAPDFCVGKDFTPVRLRYWASRLGPTGGGVAGEQVRLARVVRGAALAEAVETPIVIEVGSTRVGIRRGFDPAALRTVLDMLGGDR